VLASLALIAQVWIEVAALPYFPRATPPPSTGAPRIKGKPRFARCFAPLTRASTAGAEPPREPARASSALRGLGLRRTPQHRTAPNRSGGSGADARGRPAAPASTRIGSEPRSVGPPGYSRACEGYRGRLGKRRREPKAQLQQRPPALPPPLERQLEGGSGGSPPSISLSGQRNLSSTRRSPLCEVEPSSEPPSPSSASRHD
jgi:hypothetical protein